MRIRGMIAALLLTAGLVGLAASQPLPGQEKGPPGKGKDKGKQEVKERSEELKVDLTEPPLGLIKKDRKSVV